MTPLAILLSAVIGAWVAIHSVKEQRAIARRRATLDLLAQREWDADGISSREEFIRLRDGEGGLETWADPCHGKSTQQATIRHTLNEYELIAVGIREGILDEELYRRWFRTTLMKDWQLSQEFILRIRDLAGSNKLYAEFEWLARKWESEEFTGDLFAPNHADQAQ